MRLCSCCCQLSYFKAFKLCTSWTLMQYKCSFLLHYDKSLLNPRPLKTTSDDLCSLIKLMKMYGRFKAWSAGFILHYNPLRERQQQSESISQLIRHVINHWVIKSFVTLVTEQNSLFLGYIQTFLSGTKSWIHWGKTNAKRFYQTIQQSTISAVTLVVSSIKWLFVCFFIHCLLLCLIQFSVDGFRMIFLKDCNLPKLQIHNQSLKVWCCYLYI